MRVPQNSAAYHVQANRMETALLQKSVGTKVREAAKEDIANEIEQRCQAQIEKAEEEHEAASGINLFTMIGAAIAAVAVSICTCGVAAAALAIGGLAAIGAAAVTVAVPALVCGAIGALIGRGIGELAYKSDKDNAKDKQAEAEELNLLKKKNEDLSRRVGRSNMDKGREEVKAAYDAMLTMLDRNV